MDGVVYCMARPSWGEYFMKMAFVAAERSTCLRHNVGAVTVRDKRVLTTGYNAPASGEKHCCDLGYCNKEEMAGRRGEEVVSGKGFDDCRVIHAEENAILQASIVGVSLSGSTVYCTHQPCFHCSNKISQVGIKAVRYVFSYDDRRGIDMLMDNRIECRKVDIPNLEIGFLE